MCSSGLQQRQLHVLRIFIRNQVALNLHRRHHLRHPICFQLYDDRMKL